MRTGLLQVGKQLVEVIAGQVAVDRLKGLLGAAAGVLATMAPMRRMALRPSEEPRSRTVTGWAGAGNGRFATASSIQS